MLKINNSYKSLLTEYEYIKLFVASTISRFGDSIDIIAFSWLVYKITGSPVWLAIIFGVNSLPTILLQPITGVLVENKNKKKIMVITDFFRGICVMLIAILYILNSLNPWLLMICTFFNSTFEAFRIPSGLAIYPHIISKEKYTLAISLNNSVSRIVEIVGMGCAGIIIGVIGIGSAILIDAITFMASGIILCFLKVTTKTEENKNDTSSIKNFIKEFIDGVRYLRTFPLLVLLCFLNSIINAFLVPINSFQSAYVNSTLHLGPYAFAASSAFMSFGIGIGSLLYPYIINKTKKNIIFCMGGIVSSISYIIFSVISAISIPIFLSILLILSFFVFGLSISMIIMNVNVLFMNHVEQKYIARIGGIFNSTAMVAIPVGSFINAVIANYLEVKYIFFITGLLGTLFFIIIYYNKLLKTL